MLLKMIKIALFLYVTHIPFVVYAEIIKNSVPIEPTISRTQKPLLEINSGKKEIHLLFEEIERLKKRLHKAELEAWEAKKELEDYKSWIDLEKHRNKSQSDSIQSPDISEENKPPRTQNESTVVNSASKEPLQKQNSFYVDLLGLSHLYSEINSNLNIQYERSLSNFYSMFFGLLYSSFSLNDQSYEISKSFFGFKFGMKYYPFYSSVSQTGLWGGVKTEMLFVNQKYTDSLGTIEANDTQYIAGPEIGYKWILGKHHWFFLSPFIGFYYSSEYADLNITPTFFYTGLNAGIVF